MQNLQQRKITIYIDPKQGGPVTPMELNLLDIEMAALRMNDETMRDEVRIREIAKRIRDKFPGVEPDYERKELATLVRQLNHYTHLNRIVLVLPGVIKSNESDKELSEKVKKQLDDVGKRVEQLGRDLRKERDEHEATKAQFITLKTNYNNLRALYEKVNTQLADALLHERQARQDVERWRRIAAQAQEDIKAAQVKSGATQVDIDRLKRDSHTLEATLKEKQREWVDKEQELSNLRQQVRERESAIKNLEDTVKQRDQVIERLRSQLDDDVSLAGSASDGDWQSKL